jgi:hypothetical protein
MHWTSIQIFEVEASQTGLTERKWATSRRSATPSAPTRVPRYHAVILDLDFQVPHSAARPKVRTLRLHVPREALNRALTRVASLPAR